MELFQYDWVWMTLTGPMTFFTRSALRLGTNWHSVTLPNMLDGVDYQVFCCMSICHIHTLGFGYYRCTNSWAEHVSYDMNTSTVVIITLFGIQVAFYRFYLFSSANTVDCYRISLFSLSLP
jgi:hypothetical protein